METLRIIAVDDEPGMRLAIERALRGFSVGSAGGSAAFDFAVKTAGSGEEGVGLLESWTPDLLLLDLKLPGISGLDVLGVAAEKYPRVLTVMITAYASLETAIAATKKGAFDFLPKPYTPEELRATIRRAVRHLELQRQARQLEDEKRQVRFQFISVLGHELKAPLAAMEGFLRMLKDGSAGDDPEVRGQVLERCLARAEGMRKLILDLLDLTRIESGRKTRDLCELDLREVVRTALDGVAPAAAARGIEVRFPGEGPVTALADRGEMEIICNNLFTNAVKYNRDGGEVEVRLDQVEGVLRLAVKDTGIGLTAEEAGRLFQDFTRIKNEKTRNIPGSGLGLSIVNKLAQLYGGCVAVKSVPGEGSTFTVTLPAAGRPA